MTSSFKMIIPCLRLIMKQKARVPVPSITTQGVSVLGNSLSLLFYYCTTKAVRGKNIKYTESKSHKIF